MSIDQLRRDYRSRILEIAAEYGARNVRVFGSVARGAADSTSDVDFLVEMESGRSLLDHAGLTIALESLLGCKVDVASERGLRDRVRDRILREAVLL